MWIMLINKLPTQPSPPKLSIFWANPYHFDDSRIQQQFKEYVSREIDTDYPEKIEGRRKKELWNSYLKCDKLPDQFGWCDNLAKRLSIIYKDTQLVVKSNEYTVQTPEKLKIFLTESPCSHELVSSIADGVSKNKGDLNKDERLFYESALLDGCNEQQALLTALGVDITQEMVEFPPIGWYRCKKEYAKIYCDDWEMEE